LPERKNAKDMTSSSSVIATILTIFSLFTSIWDTRRSTVNSSSIAANLIRSNDAFLLEFKPKTAKIEVGVMEDFEPWD
jgi:hypothetical protein